MENIIMRAIRQPTTKAGRQGMFELFIATFWGACVMSSITNIILSLTK